LLRCYGIISLGAMRYEQTNRTNKIDSGN